MASAALSVVKRCTRCGETKLRGQFYTRVDGTPRGPCKECWKADARQPHVRERDRDSKFAANIRANYGMSMDDYDSMWLAQGGRCAVCGIAGSRRGRGRTAMRLAIDHDHATGAVRGLLCGMCNGGLGLFNDEPARLKLAIAYLERTV